MGALNSITCGIPAGSVKTLRDLGGCTANSKILSQPTGGATTQPELKVVSQAFWLNAATTANSS